MAGENPAARAAGEDAERLLVDAARKDPARFVDLYELHFEAVYGFIARRVRDRGVSEDLTSEVFEKALAHLCSYEWSGAPFRAWLIRIALNEIADHVKRSAREVPQAETVADPAGPPDFAEMEDRARLFRMVDRLPAEQRKVILARFVEEKSIRDVAGQLGKSEGAIKQLQLRALEKLRVLMEGGHA